MNKIIALIVIILIVVGGYFLFFNKNNVPTMNNITTSTSKETTINPSASPKLNNVAIPVEAKVKAGAVNAGTTNTNTAKKVTVNYTDNGFSPQTITIKKGDTVVFVNQSSESIWVASNPHPTHTDYPAFDEKATMSGGGSWSFTFNQTGSWGYHNHKSPSDTGTVVVQ